jgi:hypothetical protein
MSDSFSLQTSEPENRANIPSSDVATASAPGSSDPASSLRAAALLTLKSKRRKPLLDQSTSQALPSRPPPPSDVGIQLDYGQEDIASSPRLTLELPRIPSESLATEAAEDGQIREEGEISDEEVSTKPPPSDSPKQLSLPPLTTNSEATKRPTPPRSAATPMAEPALPKPKLSDRISDPPSTAVAEDVAMLVDTALVEDLLPHLIDADHVRPGLACQYLDRSQNKLPYLLQNF